MLVESGVDQDALAQLTLLSQVSQEEALRLLQLWLGTRQTVRNPNAWWHSSIRRTLQDARPHWHPESAGGSWSAGGKGAW